MTINGLGNNSPYYGQVKKQQKDTTQKEQPEITTSAKEVKTTNNNVLQVNDLNLILVNKGVTINQGTKITQVEDVELGKNYSGKNLDPVAHRIQKGDTIDGAEVVNIRAREFEKLGVRGVYYEFTVSDGHGNTRTVNAMQFI